MTTTDNGVARILRERSRQISDEGWTPAHDATHDRGEIVAAAAAYALHAAGRPIPDDLWPWDASWWKPGDDPLRALEKAGALIAAEIDRLLEKRRVGDIDGA